MEGVEVIDNNENEGSNGNKVSGVVVVCALFFTLVIAVFIFVKQAAIGGVVYGIGGAFGSVIPAFVIVGIFQISKRLRCSRGRWKVFMWAQLIFYDWASISCDYHCYVECITGQRAMCLRRRTTKSVASPLAAGF